MTVLAAACSGCGACVATCPAGALRPAAGAPELVPGRCTACWDCVEICPTAAVVRA